MKKVFAKWWQKALTAFLSALGVSVCVSCGDGGLDPYVDIPAMYGMPPNWGGIHGKVTYGDNPVNGMQVTLTDEDNNQLDRLETDGEGNYRFPDMEPGKTVVLTVEDIDGMDNGWYETESKKVTVTDEDTTVDFSLREKIEDKEK